MSTTEVFTIAEAADALRVSKRTIYRLFRSAQLPYSKVGGRVLVPKADVTALINAGRRTK